MIKKRFSQSLIRPATIIFLIITVVARILNYDYIKLYVNTLVPDYLLLAISYVGEALSVVRVTLFAALIAVTLQHFGTYKRAFNVKAALLSLLFVFVEWVSKFLLYLRLGEFIGMEMTAIALYSISFFLEVAFIIVALITYKLLRSRVLSKADGKADSASIAHLPVRTTVITTMVYAGVALLTQGFEIFDFVTTYINITKEEIISMVISSVVVIVIYVLIGLLVAKNLPKYFENRVKTATYN